MPDIDVRDPIAGELRDLLRGPLSQEIDGAGGPHTEQAAPVSDQAEEADRDTVPAFPEIAWRGAFNDYRVAMEGTTEASDVAHFITLLAAAAVNLGRRVSMFAGDEIFPNMYLVFFGPTGDKKTTAERRIFSRGLIAPGIPVLRGGGSPEGLADQLHQDGGGQTPPYLFVWEEISSILARGRWSASTILEFLTETFDCPAEYRLLYRKEPVHLVAPTPTILAGTTSEWFWKNARPDDFHGGFGNRIAYFTGSKKPPLPCPREPDADRMEAVRTALASLSDLPPRTRAVFSEEARILFERFYRNWEGKTRTGLLASAVKRIHVYVRKIALVYASLEGTLPEVTFDQTKAAIAVARYAAECARFLIDEQAAQSRPEGEVERRMLEWVKKNGGARKRIMQQTLTKIAGSCKVFNETLNALLRAGEIEIREGRVYLTQ